MTPAPPRIAERLLGFVIRRPEIRDGVVGDLAEEFAACVRRQGLAAGRRWYWRQALVLCVHLGVAAPSPPPVRRVFPDIPDSHSRWSMRLSYDLRAAWRALWQQPAVSLTIVATLALGLAANATIFALSDAIVLRPFRFAGVDRTVLIASAADTDQFFDRESVARGDFLEWQERTTDTFGQLAAIEWWNANLSGQEYPEQLPAFRVTPAFFTVLGTAADLGRTFSEADARPDAPRVAMMSHGLWVRRFGSDPAILQRTIRLDGEPYTVVGVAKEGFSLPLSADVWAPLVMTPDARLDRSHGDLMVVGRLRDDQSLAAARAKMAALVADERRAYPETNSRRDVTVRTFTNGFGDPGAPAFTAIFQAAAVLLLLVACANVMNLLLARGVERRRELAIRLALGAGRGRLVYQVLLEGTMLAVVASVLAAGLAWAAVEACRAAFPPSIIRYVPGWTHMHVQPRTLLVTALLAAVATIASSLVPALRSARSAGADDLRQGTRHTSDAKRQRLRTLLATVQIALAASLLTAAGLTIGAVQRAANDSIGFSPDQVLTARLSLPEIRYTTSAQREAFVRSVLDRLRTLPSVNVAAALTVLPYSNTNVSTAFWLETDTPRDNNARHVDLRSATPDWNTVLRVPVLQGRGLSEADRADSLPVAVVSQSLARQMWPGKDPIGQRFRLDKDGPLVTTVGVVGDVAHHWLVHRMSPTVYRPVAQTAANDFTFVLRTAGDPADLGAAVRAAVANLDPDQPVASIRTYPQLVADSTFGLRFAADALSIIAMVGLLVAIVGVYSLMAYLASRRTRELGVRVALGATRAHITRLTLGQAVTIAGWGAGGGLVLALIFSRMLETSLFGLVSANYLFAIVVALGLGAVAVAASYLPARRAASVDPLVALRAE